jgi:hypothetical protein
MGLTDSTLTAAPLTVTIEEKCNISGIPRGSKTTLTIATVTDLYTQIISVPTGGMGIAEFATTPGSGTFKTTMKYLRITNKDDTNFVTITFADHATDDSADDLFAVKVEAGKSIMLGSTSFDASVDDADHLLTANQTIKEIKAQADTAAVDIEIVIGEG